MDEIIIFIFVFAIFCIVACSIIYKERNNRKKAEQELETTRNALKEVCEKILKDNDSIRAKITYQVYFGEPVDHTGDGFIDGYE